MTHGHGQQSGDELWEQGVGQDEGGQRGKIGTTVKNNNNKYNKKIFLKTVM